MTSRIIPVDRIKLLIFDLDGTLIDSRQDLVNSVNAMLQHLGRPVLPAEVIASYVGDGAPMLVRRALGDPDDGTYFHAALRFFLDYYREHKLDHTYVYAGMREALGDLRFGAPPGEGEDARRSARAAAKGEACASRRCGALERRMAVLTNKPVVPSKQIVEALGLNEFFMQVYGGNSFHTKKPDPQGARALLEETGTRPEEAVIIGDSDVDVLTGRNAGLWTIGVTYGFAPHSLEGAPPDVLVHSPAELVKIFGA